MTVRDSYKRAVAIWLGENTRDSRGRKRNPDLIRGEPELRAWEVYGSLEVYVEFQYSGNRVQHELRWEETQLADIVMAIAEIQKRIEKEEG